MTEERISPLRARMIEDMRIRGMGEKAQQSHIRAIHRPAGHSHRECPVYGRPRGCKCLLWLRHRRCGRVPSCIRPLDATFNVTDSHGEFEDPRTLRKLLIARGLIPSDEQVHHAFDARRGRTVSAQMQRMVTVISFPKAPGCMHANARR